MKNQIEIVKEIADGMIEIGGFPTNVQFYCEFDMRLRDALGISLVNVDNIITVSTCGCTVTQACKICASAKGIDWSMIDKTE